MGYDEVLIIVGVVLVAQAVVYFILRSKSKQAKDLIETQDQEITEEIKEEDKEISIEDFMFQRKLGKWEIRVNS